MVCTFVTKLFLETTKYSSIFFSCYGIQCHLQFEGVLCFRCEPRRLTTPNSSNLCSWRYCSREGKAWVAKPRGKYSQLALHYSVCSSFTRLCRSNLAFTPDLSRHQYRLPLRVTLGRWVSHMTCQAVRRIPSGPALAVRLIELSASQRVWWQNYENLWNLTGPRAATHVRLREVSAL